jgi:hypothetical protein
MTHTTDALMVLLDEVRTQRPPVYLADEWAAWLQAVAQCICALPTAPRQWAAAVLVAGDLINASPGLSMLMAYAAVQEAVQRAAGVKI